jgi:pyruvate,water dikinase
VRGYADAAGHDPEADIRARAAARDRLAAELPGRFRNPLKRAVLRYVVAQAQRSAAIRENLKDIAIRVIASARAVICEVGRRLAQRGIVAAADDVFFLELAEVAPALFGSARFDPRARVAERRAAYERNLGLTPPAIVVGRYDPQIHRPDRFDSTALTLKGLAVSPGRVTGPARIVLLADASVRVLPGEILIAPFTDPGWTPYFIPAAGIVIDQGGLMSHGSIIAREYGIPAVVNVGPATKLIKTGQLVEVDGDTGTVRVLGDETLSSDPPESP